MGYTHYFPQRCQFTDYEWAQIKSDVSRIVNYCTDQGIVLRREPSEDNPPQIDDDLIRLNGAGDTGYETFLLARRGGVGVLTYGRQQRMRCKTDHKPYDLAVCLCLLRISQVAPDVLTLSSDGDWEKDWRMARAAYDTLFMPPYDEAIGRWV